VRRSHIEKYLFDMTQRQGPVYWSQCGEELEASLQSELLWMWRKKISGKGLRA
jgi:hypothetical protein